MEEKTNQTREGEDLQRNIAYSRAKARLTRLYNTIVRQPRLRPEWQELDKPLYELNTRDEVADYVSVTTNMLVEQAERETVHGMTTIEARSLGEDESKHDNLRYRLQSSAKKFAELQARTNRKNRLMALESPTYAINLFDGSPEGHKLLRLELDGRNLSKDPYNMSSLWKWVQRQREKVVNRTMTETEYDYLVNTDIDKIRKEKSRESENQQVSRQTSERKKRKLLGFLRGWAK